MKLHELQEARAQVVVSMRALADLAETEKRDLNGEEEKTFRTLKTEIADLDKRIGYAQAVAEAERAAPAIVHGKVGDGAYEERARGFSLQKAILSALPRDVGGGGVDAGFEREISQEVERRAGRKAQGVLVPDEVFQVERRTLLVGSSAADIVPPVHRDDLFINLLRVKLVVARLGGTFLDGLVGTPIDIPRQTGSSTAQWVAEDGSLTETDATFDDVTLQPKTVGAMTSYSRRTLLNASPSIEQILRNDLASIIANAVDAKALLGDGTSNTPTGVTNTSGVNDIAVTATPTFVEILGFPAAIDAGNALEGSLGWVTAPHIVKKLRSTLVAASTDSRMLQTDPDNLVGYPIISTNAIVATPGMSPQDTGEIIFGDWSQLLIGSWTGVDILLNPYETTAYAKGRVMIRAMKDVDVAVRVPAAFAFSNDITV
jgi:HK97 family phage major capsid protein